MAKFNSDEVKLAAESRWVDILVSVAGIPIEILDGNHHPCPRCGGTDRFRAFTDGTGGVFCNQCRNSKNSDGFAAVQWMLDCGFPEAVAKVAEYLGMAPSKGKKKSSTPKPAADPAKDLEFMPWAPLLAAHFLDAKKGITEASLLAQGCRMARYKSQTVIVWPIIGPDLDTEKPVGYVIMEYKCRKIPVWNIKGEQVDAIEKKVVAGSKPGFVGFEAINKLKLTGLVECVWKCEGLTDQAALWEAMPEHLRAKHVVITTANGSRENPKWQADILSNFNVNVLHDCDQPGQAGATKWSQSIAGRIADGRAVRNIILPYTIEETKGNDIRDWINDGNKYGDLLGLVDRTEPIIVARNEDGSVDVLAQEYPIQTLIMEKLQLKIVDVEENGSIRVFSMLLRKPTVLRSVERIRKENLIFACGPPAMEVISEDPDNEETFSLKDVKEAIAYFASKQQCDRQLHGVGVWQGLDEYGNETETIVLVNNTQGARWNGDKVLRPVLEPAADGLSLNFGAGDADWFDFDLLEQNLKNATDVDWRKNVIETTHNLFARWKWKNPDVDPTLMTGLCLATWVQTLWKWRPLVSIVGESNSGKSFLFEALGGNEHQLGIFGKLSFKQAKSTEAGIRQGVGKTGKVVICDEFEKSSERVRILEMMRASTRGDMIARGTAGDQKGKKFTLRHICFTAAIETGLQRQPDLNRFIQFTLMKPDRADHGKLILPGGRELYELGQKLLAIAVTFAIKSKSLAVRLKDTKAEVDSRSVESYAVPAAILGLAYGFTEDQCRNLLKTLAEGSIDKDAQGESDQDELLDAILSATVNCGGRDGLLSVAQIIEDFRSSRYLDHNGKMEAAGVRLIDGEGLFINTKLVGRVLLRGTSWEGQRIDQILIRLKHVTRTARMIAGRSLRGVMVPEAYFRPTVEQSQQEFV